MRPCRRWSSPGGADPYEEQREAFGRKHGVTNLYSDYKEMLEKERPDIVSICTSARPRADIVTTIAAMDVGVKAIWAEKPISMSLEEADAMVESCRDAGIVLAVNCARRWDAWYSKARELIDDGTIGEVMQVTVYQVGNLSHNSHMLNLARFLAGGSGRVEWVFGDLNDETAAGPHEDDDRGGISYLALREWRARPRAAGPVAATARLRSWVRRDSSGCSTTPRTWSCGSGTRDAISRANCSRDGRR